MPPLEIISQALLWVIVIIEGLLLLALARQIGFLHERVGVTGARITNAGPRIGDEVQVVHAKDIDGRAMVLGAKGNTRRLLMFISTGCGVCSSLIPHINQLAQAEADNLEVNLVAFGTTEENARKYAAEHSLQRGIPLVVSDEVAAKYNVRVAPYGLLIDRRGILQAKGLVNAYSDIESLLNAEELGVRSIREYAERITGSRVS